MRSPRAVFASDVFMNWLEVIRLFRSTGASFATLSSVPVAPGHRNTGDLFRGHLTGPDEASSILVIIMDGEKEPYQDTSGMTPIELQGATVVSVPPVHRNNVEEIAKLLQPHGDFQIPIGNS